MKTGEELVMLYSNLLSNYPGLTGFIDPLHPKVNTVSYTIYLLYVFLGYYQLAIYNGETMH